MLCPWLSSCRICFSKSKARELLADLDPLCVEPRIGTCSLALGAKETGVDPKYLGIYWTAGLSAPTSVSVTGRGPPPCLTKWNGHFRYQGTGRCWVNGTLETYELDPTTSIEILYIVSSLKTHSAFVPPTGPCNGIPECSIADRGLLFGFLLHLFWSRQGFYSSHSLIFK